MSLEKPPMALTRAVLIPDQVRGRTKKPRPQAFVRPI